MPWWGVLLICIVFCVWTMFSILIGAAIHKTAVERSQKVMSLEEWLRRDA